MLFLSYFPLSFCLLCYFLLFFCHRPKSPTMPNIHSPWVGFFDCKYLNYGCRPLFSILIYTCKQDRITATVGYFAPRCSGQNSAPLVGIYVLITCLLLITFPTSPVPQTAGPQNCGSGCYKTNNTALIWPAWKQNVWLDLRTLEYVTVSPVVSLFDLNILLDV